MFLDPTPPGGVPWDAAPVQPPVFDTGLVEDESVTLKEAPDESARLLLARVLDLLANTDAWVRYW